MNQTTYAYTDTTLTRWHP